MSKKRMLSEYGWDYYNFNMIVKCKDDPGGWDYMKIAIWFIRMEMKQRGRTFKKALANSAKKYELDKDLLYSRYQSNCAFYRWAKRYE